MDDADVIQEITTYAGFAKHGVDEKRRLQIPAKWRPANTKVEMLMSIWRSHSKGACIRVFPPKQMLQLLKKIEETPSDDPTKPELEWLIGVDSETVPVDRTGRVCLPERMATAAGIANEAVFVGLVNKFEIWNPERFAAQDATYREGDKSYYKRIL